MKLEEASETSDAQELSPSEIEPLEEEEDDRELIVQPQSLNVTLLQQSFHDTLLHLKSSNDVRIRIKVHNQPFLSLFK